MKSEGLSSSFCKKGMSPKEIHEGFMETLGKSPSYSSEKKWSAEFKRGTESFEDDERLAAPKMPNDENVKVVHTLVMCDRRLDLRSIASEVGVAVQS